MTVTIPEELAEHIDATIRAGRFVSESEVISAALTIWEKREAIRREEIARLKQAWDEGKASGEPREVDLEEFLREMRAEFDHD